MVALSFQPDRESLRTLSRLERETPKTFAYAYRGAVARSLKALKALMRQQGGKYAPAFAPRRTMTTTLHPGRKPGGVLADPKRMYYKKLGPASFLLSWVGTLGDWGATHYQEGKTYTFSQDQRAYFHKVLRSKDVPYVYDRPARPVIEPLHKYLAANFARYFMEAYKRREAYLVKRGKAVA